METDPSLEVSVLSEMWDGHPTFNSYSQQMDLKVINREILLSAFEKLEVTECLWVSGQDRNWRVLGAAVVFISCGFARGNNYVGCLAKRNQR